MLAIDEKQSLSVNGLGKAAVRCATPKSTPKPSTSPTVTAASLPPLAPLFILELIPSGPLKRIAPDKVATQTQLKAIQKVQCLIDERRQVTVHSIPLTLPHTEACV